MTKRVKLWIILGVVCALIFTLGMVFGLAFRLKKVDVEFLARRPENSTKLEINIAEKVKEDGEFKFGKNLMFSKFDENISKIERNNPYVKVNYVRRYYPNILRIYISERIPEFRMRDANNAELWYILDSEFKILDAVYDIEFSEFFATTIEIDPDSISISGTNGKAADVGDFISFSNNYDKYLKQISDGIYGRNKDSATAHSIAISRAENGALSFVITMRNKTMPDGKGCKIFFAGTEDLVKKANVGVTAYEQETTKDPNLNTPDNTIIIRKINGEYVGLLNEKQD